MAALPVGRGALPDHLGATGCVMGAARYLLFVACTVAMTGFLAYATYTTARALQRWRPPWNPLLNWAENLLRVGLVALCLFLGWLSGLPAVDLGWTFPRPAAQVAWGVIGGVVLAAFFYGGTRLLSATTGRRYYSSLLVDLITPNTGRELVLVLLAFAPSVLLEELLFRSLWVGGMSPLVAPAVLVVVVGLFFGLLHSPQGVWGMTGAALAGVIFGLLFLWAGSILLPVVAHYTTNAVQIVAAMFIRQRNVRNQGEQQSA